MTEALQNRAGRQWCSWVDRKKGGGYVTRRKALEKSMDGDTLQLARFSESMSISFALVRDATFSSFWT